MSRFQDPNSLRPKKTLTLNKQNLKSFKDIAQKNPKVEFLYLRENRFTSFVPYVALNSLKVLDLSMNDITGKVDFLADTPNLRHLYLTGNRITTLDGINSLGNLETLCLSDNAIESFEGLDGLPNLRVLSLNYNSITTFTGYPYLPSLHTLSLVKNPIADAPSYRSMAVAASNPTLASIDGVDVDDSERSALEHYRGKLVYCITEGFVVQNPAEAEEQCDAFLLNLQRTNWKQKPLQLQHIGLSSEDGGNLPREGVKLDLSVCMQDVRPTKENFFSKFIFPVVFRVSGDATEVLLVGSINKWQAPIPLERNQDGEEVYFSTTLYLPAGDYEYRYIVDGTEKLNDASKTTSKYGQGMCNLYHVAESAAMEDDQETILHIRWMRSNSEHGFELIDGENGLSYTPTSGDIGYSIRAEVLAYDKGAFSFLYFDISTPVSAGEPVIRDLEIKGTVAEGDTLTADYQYFGGNEGNTAVKWYRLAGDDEAPQEIDLEDPHAGYTLTIDDIGRRIKVEVTPIREDWVTGQPNSQTTPIVTAGVPTCRSIQIVGDLLQDVTVVCETTYSGGYEGDSKIQWFRFDYDNNDFVPIVGENSREYLLALADVDKPIAVEYVPVSRENVEGETARLVLDFPVAAAHPQVRNLQITGTLEEHSHLSLEYDYFGGIAGAHKIEWLRKDSSGHKRTIGRPGANVYTLTKHDIGCFIEVSFKPVRKDGTEGDVVVVSTPEKVRAGVPQLLVFQLSGESAEGSILSITAEYSGGEEGESIIEWARAATDGSRDFDVFLRQKKRYVIQSVDSGRQLRVSYTPVRAGDGEKGETKQRWFSVPDFNAGETEPAAEPEPAAAPAPAEESAPAKEEAEEPAAAAEEPAASEEPAAASEPEPTATSEQPAEEETQKPAEEKEAAEEPAPAQDDTAPAAEETAASE